MEMNKQIGFVSTRFAGTDGVSLEASKWASIFKSLGHACFWFAGVSDRSAGRSMTVPEAHFHHAANQWINERILGRKERPPEVTDAIHEMRAFLKTRLRAFLQRFSIDLLVVENALAIPMHLPLGLAVTEVIAETRIPTIAHHHDFYWERTRYAVNAAGDFLRMAFPPSLYNIEHVVINTFAREALAHRTGLSSIIIPNVLDFENPPLPDLEKTKHFRESIGLGAEDVMILQPTRVVARKGIEHAIELVRELNDPRYKLVVSHEAGDEGQEYAAPLLRHQLRLAAGSRSSAGFFRGRFRCWKYGRGGAEEQSITGWDRRRERGFIIFKL
jgi:glycosyltransferase involved in cell wall biosynthesis